MPKERIWGDVVTVRRGDLDVLRARTQDDLWELLRPTPPTDERRAASGPATDHPEFEAVRRDRDRLFHRAQLYATFVEDVERLATADDLLSSTHFRERAAVLRTALTANESTDRTATDYPELEELIARQRAELDRLREQTRVLRRRDRELLKFVDDLTQLDQEISVHEQFTVAYRDRASRLRHWLSQLSSYSPEVVDGDSPTEQPSAPTDAPTESHESGFSMREWVLRNFVARLAAVHHGSSDDGAGHLAFRREYESLRARLTDHLLDDVTPDESAELVLLRRFAQDVAQANAADGVPLKIRERFTELTNQLAGALLDINRATVAPPNDDPAPELAEVDALPGSDGDPDEELEAELEAERAATARWATILARPRRFRRDTDAPDDVTTGNPAGDPGDPDEELQLQLFLQLGWERDSGSVQVGIKGHCHDDGREYDLGGHFLTLSWPQTNRAIKKFRVARDQSWGAPE